MYVLADSCQRNGLFHDHLNFVPLKSIFNLTPFMVLETKSLVVKQCLAMEFLRTKL